MYSFTEKQIQEIARQLQNGESPKVNLSSGNVELLQDTDVHEGASGATNSVIIVDDMSASAYIQLMKNFVESIEEDEVRGDFEKVFRGKSDTKAGFRKMLDYHDAQRPKWFHFKNEAYMDYVKVKLLGL